MKNLLLAVCIFLIHSIYAQKAPVPSNKTIRISTPKMSVDPADLNTVLLKMEFNGSIPKNQLGKIKSANVISISLVYTKYRLNEKFDQSELNNRRMEQLYSMVSALRENTNIQWYWVEQTGCDNPDACDDFFHGFVITMSPPEEKLKREAEFALLDYYADMYDGKADTNKIDSLISKGKLNLAKICTEKEIKTPRKTNKLARIGVVKKETSASLKKALKKELEARRIYNLELVMDKQGKFSYASDAIKPAKADQVLSILNSQVTRFPAKYNNKKIASHFTITVEMNGKTPVFTNSTEPFINAKGKFNPDTFLFSFTSKITCEYVDTSIIKLKKTDKYGFPDVVTRVLDRNKQWENSLIVTDVTGSMFPYLAQFQYWHKLNFSTSDNIDFVFFNDGDTKPDFLKRAGHTGGVYYVKTRQYDEMVETMKKAMMAGGGGDTPENNIEAVIEGLKRNPSCKQVIMIADNSATPRDLSLLEQVKVPIRLILCGAMGERFNNQYVEMIRKNGGSIHTIERDIYDLEKFARVN